VLLYFHRFSSVFVLPLIVELLSRLVKESLWQVEGHGHRGAELEFDRLVQHGRVDALESEFVRLELEFARSGKEVESRVTGAVFAGLSVSKGLKGSF